MSSLNRSYLFESFIQHPAAETEQVVPVIILPEKEYPEWLISQPEITQQWVKNNHFEPKKGTVLALPGADGKIIGVIAGLMHDQDFWVLARVASLSSTGLPSGKYQVMDMPFYTHYSCLQSPLFYLAWGLEQYRFTVYKPSFAEASRYKSLVIVDEKKRDFLKKTLDAIHFVRDLINTPAQDLNPVTLEEVVKEFAQKHQASFHSIVGDKLLTEGFPAIHAVGRASVFEPRLLEMNWGESNAPLVTLVGKGVCFDTGGLDLKSASGMLLMRKDMSGSAQVLGLASLIIEMKLPIRLRVLIPAVENSVSGNAYRPGDIIKTRKGLSVNIDNTDAEGRVILSDTLAYAMETPPEILIDIASLTGMSMMAFGYDIAPFFTNDETCASELMSSAAQVNEPLWRMPLYAPYKEFISPETTDLTNASLLSYAGSITAALFLQEFANVREHPNMTWLHFDTSAWNDKSKPGKPMGGDATVIRSLFNYLSRRFAQ